MRFELYDINRFDHNIYDDLGDALQRVCKIGSSNLPYHLNLAVVDYSTGHLATITRILGSRLKSPLEFCMGALHVGLMDNTNDLNYLLNNPNSIFHQMVNKGRAYLHSIVTIQTDIDYMYTQFRYGAVYQTPTYQFVKHLIGKNHSVVNWQKEGF